MPAAVIRSGLTRVRSCPSNRILPLRGLTSQEKELTGRRLAYLNRFDEAIDVFTRGLERFPDSYKLLRFRGRKLARTRQFEAGLADYARGIALVEHVQDSYEPDGLINARNQFLGSYRSNMHYYHAQTSWAVGDYAATLAGMDRSAREPLVQNDDHQIAIRYWRYLALRKLGRHDEARAAVADAPAGLALLENDAYYDGVRYLQGRLDERQCANRHAYLQKSHHLFRLISGLQAGQDQNMSPGSKLNWMSAHAS